MQTKKPLKEGRGARIFEWFVTIYFDLLSFLGSTTTVAAASLSKMSFLFFSTVFSPIPAMLVKSSAVLNKPFSSLYLTMASAFFCLMPYKASEIVFASAVLMLTGAAIALTANKDNNNIIFFIYAHCFFTRI